MTEETRSETESSGGRTPERPQETVSGGRGSIAQLFFAAVQEHAPVAMLLVNGQRRIVAANRTAARLGGRSNEGEVVGLVPGEAVRCVHRLDDPRGCEYGPHCETCPVGLSIATTLADHLPRQGVVGWLPMGEGADRPRAMRVATAYVEGEGEGWVLACLEDVTDQRRAEEALLASEEKYRQLVEDLSDVIYATDAEGVLTYVSPASTRILGYAPEQLVGKHFSVIVHGDDLPAMKERFRQVLLQRLGPWEFRYRHGSGEVRWGRSLSNPIKKDGVSVGLRGVFSDITEMRRLQEQLSQAQKLEAVGQLAGGLAHDMNNLFQAMLSTASLLRGEWEGEDSAASRCAELEDLIRRGSALTRQLLLFSRRETTRPQALDLNQVVANLLGMLRRLVREDVTFRVQLADQPLPLWADQGHLEQVVLNLVMNAVEAMPAGGVLQLRTAAEEGSTVVLQVADTGCGIPEGVRERIFEPFFTTKGESGGTGLGLAVVYGIVTGLGGTVAVESREGEGSTFTVRLPRAEGQARTPSTPVPSVAPLLVGPRGQGEHVLLVEDEGAIRTSLAEVLTALGYRVTAVGSVGEAGLVGEQPDVLLTDLVLPDAQGLDLAVSLVERWPGLAVILMSGYTADEAVRLGSAAGLVRFLQKPFDIPRLAEELRNALEERG